MNNPPQDSDILSEMSGASHGTQKSSASGIANTPAQFQTWSYSAGVILYRASVDPTSRALFRRLCEFKFPSDIIQFLEIVKQRDHFLKYEVRLADGIQSWARNNPESIARDGTDECDIKKSFNHVLGPVFARACSSTVFNKEMAQRRAIDDLIQAVFSVGFREGARAEVEFEADIRLRRSKLFTTSKAIADTLVLYPLQEGKQQGKLFRVLAKAMEQFNDPNGLSLKSRSYSDIIGDELKIILFAMEAKREPSLTNANQLCFDLSTAQSQRRALGLKDNILFGGVYVDGRLSVYSSYWEESLTIVEFQGDFYLREPMDLIRCWVFLRRLHDDVCDRSENEAREFDPDKAIQSIREHQWRADDRGTWKPPPGSRKKSRSSGPRPGPPAIPEHPDESMEPTETLGDVIMRWLANIREPYAVDETTSTEPEDVLPTSNSEEDVDDDGDSLSTCSTMFEDMTLLDKTSNEDVAHHHKVATPCPVIAASAGVVGF